MRNGIRWTGYRRWCSACTTIGRLTLVGQLVAHVAALPACADAHVRRLLLELMGLLLRPGEKLFGGNIACEYLEAQGRHG